MVTTRSQTATHWGAYEVEVEDGRIVALHPFKDDQDPSPIGFVSCNLKGRS